MHRHNKETGFSLLEVLITILVLSIGLLGFAGLQAQSLRTNSSASQGSAATALANEIINRMRANRASAATPAGAYSETRAGQLGVLNPACDTPAGCLPAAQVLHDLAQWDAAIAATLPNGLGVVCRDTTPNDLGAATPTEPTCSGDGPVYAIKIWWGPDLLPGPDGDDVPDFSFVTSHQ